MRDVIFAILVCLVLWVLVGCGPQRSSPPSVAGPLKTAPAATKDIDAATQTAIANKANAVATGNKPAEKAADEQLVQTEKATVRGSLHPFYLITALLLGIAGYLAFQGNYMAAMRLAGGAISLSVGSVVTAWISDHREMIIVLGVLFGFAELIYHYRTVIENKVKAIAHLHLGGTIANAEGEVKVALVHGWARATSTTVAATHAALAFMHLTKAASPTVASINPAAPAPAAAPLIPSALKG